MKRKQFKKFLDNKKYDFVNGMDYRVTSRPVNEIYMTMDVIKCICVMVPTEKVKNLEDIIYKWKKYF